MDSDVSLYGKCRCCLTEGEHRDVMKEYYSKGAKEVYFDMFLECFNVFLSTLSEGNNLICTSCIQRLRDANNFRMMVVNAERQLQAACERTEQPDTEIDKPPEFCEIKQEFIAKVKEEPEEPENCIEIELNFDGNPEILVDRRRLKTDESKLLARFKPKNLKMLPKRNALYNLCPKYAAYMDMLQGKKISAKDIQASLARNADSNKIKPSVKLRKRYVTDKTAIVNNSLAILENSNVTAFRSKSTNGLPCFYCKEVFDNIDKLREHQMKHSPLEKKKSLYVRSADCMVINVDVTDLRCTICGVALSNLKDLKSHLVSIHDKKIYTEFQDRVIPFIMRTDNTFFCQICGYKHQTFGSLERHMNGHYRNYVCDECGTGFVTSYRLKVHAKTIHVEGTFPCEMCNKVFPSQAKHKSHVDTVHKMLQRFKCPKCVERFTDYFKRHQHLVDKHGVPQLAYKCNVCDKVFPRRYQLSQHMKKVHLEERSFQCAICFNTFFAKRDLESHMVKHNGARVFECAVCNKAYARKKTLKEHMRIHNNDRRFACQVCGQAFVQNCSLKGHIKTHHPELLELREGK